MNTTKAIDQVEKKIVHIVADKHGVREDQVHRESRYFVDLPTDSLTMVEIVMDLEDAFDMHIPDNDTKDIRTVGDTIDYVVRHM